jgi:hypothetical protein
MAAYRCVSSISSLLTGSKVHACMVCMLSCRYADEHDPEKGGGILSDQG